MPKMKMIILSIMKITGWQEIYFVIFLCLKIIDCDIKNNLYDKLLIDYNYTVFHYYHKY